MTVPPDLDLESFALHGAIHRLQHAHHFTTLHATRERSFAQPDAFQEMTTLVLEGFAGLYPRADDVAIADLEAEFSIIQRF